MNLPKIKQAIQQQKSRTFKLITPYGSYGGAHTFAWDNITVRMQFRVVHGLWESIRHA